MGPPRLPAASQPRPLLLEPIPRPLWAWVLPEVWQRLNELEQQVAHLDRERRILAEQINDPGQTSPCPYWDCGAKRCTVAEARENDWCGDGCPGGASLHFTTCYRFWRARAR